MNRKSVLTIGMATVWLAVLGGLAIAAQDKYTVKVPGGLAFSEFRGYEAWQTISISRNEKVMAVILGNPAMIDAYQAGIPANGKPVPDGAKMAKVHWIPKPNAVLPGGDRAGHPAERGLHGEGQQEVRGQRRMGICRVRLQRRSPIRSRPAPRLARRRRGTTPSAGSRATRERRREITCLRIREAVSADRMS